MDDQSTKLIAEHMGELPSLVQTAITRADVPAKMRELASAHKLHVDQWEGLKREVMFTLVGITEPDDLTSALEEHVGLSAQDADDLVGMVDQQIFIPIREELEHALLHPSAREEQVTDVEAMRRQILSEEHVAPSAQTQPTDEKAEAASGAAQESVLMPQQAATIVPATPPQPVPTGKVERTPISTSYNGRLPSTERKEAAGDPYRELPQ